MLQRGFTEIDLRTMLEHAIACRPDFMEGRWIIETHLRQQSWEIVVEPDLPDGSLVVITAYPL